MYRHTNNTPTLTLKSAVSAQHGHESPSMGWRSWVTHEPINMCWQQSKAPHCNYKRWKQYIKDPSPARPCPALQLASMYRIITLQQPPPHRAEAFNWQCPPWPARGQPSCPSLYPRSRIGPVITSYSCCPLSRSTST